MEYSQNFSEASPTFLGLIKISPSHDKNSLLQPPVASEGGNSNSPPRVDCNKAAHTLTEGGIQIIISTIIVNPPGQWWMDGWMEATAKVLLLTD